MPLAPMSIECASWRTFPSSSRAQRATLGQVGAILKGKTECYDCTEKAKQKTYPIGTIRNTPSELIHCVVWAKNLFK